MLGRSLCLLVAMSLCACLWQGEAAVLTGTDTRLTVLHTSDIHSRLFPFELATTAGDRSLGLDDMNAPFGGGARLAYIVRRERERADRVLHLDSGDCFQGAPIFNRNLGEAELRLLSLIGLDAAVIGNHEFDAGVANLVDKLAAYARFDVLAANYVFADPEDLNRNSLGRMAQPYALYNVGGLKVAVIGMANLGSLTSIVEGGNSLDLTPLEQNTTMQHYIDLLHGSVDLIFALSHLGLTEDEDLVTGYEKVVWKNEVPAGWTVIEDFRDGRVLVNVPGVTNLDAVVGGHLHIVLNPPKRLIDRDGREVVVMHSGAFAKFVGRLDMVVRDDEQRGGKRIASHKYQVFPIDERLAGYEDPVVTEMLEPFELDLRRVLDLERVIAYVPQTIMRRSATGNGDSGLGNLVAESMRTRRQVEAELAVTNTLGIRDNFYPGPLTLEDMFNVFPFENSLTLMSLSGRELKELVNFITERSASRGCQSQAQVSGITFTMDCGQVLANERNPAQYKEPGHITSVGGRSLDLNNDGTVDDGEAAQINDATFKVATNDYIANGGSGFRVLKRNTTKFNTGVSLRDALIDYLGTLQRCGQYERDVAHYCERQDVFSQQLCAQTADADRIAQYTGQQGAQGPYADTPCVIGREDNRIKRKTAEGLDELPDELDPEAQ